MLSPRGSHANLSTTIRPPPGEGVPCSSTRPHIERCSSCSRVTHWAEGVCHLQDRHQPLHRSAAIQFASTSMSTGTSPSYAISASPSFGQAISETDMDDMTVDTKLLASFDGESGTGEMGGQAETSRGLQMNGSGMMHHSTAKAFFGCAPISHRADIAPLVLTGCFRISTAQIITIPLFHLVLFPKLIAPPTPSPTTLPPQPTSSP